MLETYIGRSPKGQNEPPASRAKLLAGNEGEQHERRLEDPVNLKFMKFHNAMIIKIM